MAQYKKGIYEFEIIDELTDGTSKSRKVIITVGKHGVPVINSLWGIPDDVRTEMLEQIQT